MTFTGGGRTELAADGSHVIKGGPISVTGAGTQRDLKDNKLISRSGTAVGTLSGATYTGLTGLIQSGRAGGAWNGDGIITTSASGNLTTLGVATASQAKGISFTQIGVWSGQTVTGSDALVMYTYGGDATLDGKINVDDYGRIDSNVTLPNASGWYNGDFNYDGKVNVDDYGIIDFNVGVQGAPFPTASAGWPTSVGLSSIPEPASIALVLSACVGAASRRKRRG
jgi:hypothetical protein